MTDIHADNLQRAVDEFDATPVGSDDILSLPVDVVAPCAMGAVLNDQSIPAIRAAIAAGAANNLLDRPEHDAALKHRGILYAPDFAINAGGIIDVFYERTGGSPEQIRAHVDTIGDTLAEIFQRSDRTGLPTGEIANELAEERFRKHAAGAGLAPRRLACAG